MQRMKQAWHYVLAEPFTWMFYCFFQPIRFRREYERTNSLARLVSMLRLTLPMFLVSYPLALLTWIILYQAFPELISTSFSTKAVFISDMSTVLLLLATAWATILGIIWGLILGVSWDIGWGIVGGIAVGIAMGISWSTIFSGVRGDTGVIIIGAAGSIAGGFAGSIIVHIIARSPRGILGIIFSGIVGAIVGGVAAGIATVCVGGISMNALKGTEWGVVTGSAMSIGRYIADNIRANKEKDVGASSALSVVGSISISIVGGILSGIGTDILISITHSVTEGARITISENIMVGIILGCAFAIVGGIASGRSSRIIERIALAILMAIILAILLIITSTFVGSITGSIAGGIAVAVAYIVSYFPSYYRLPLYPVSAFSGLKAYLASQRNPLRVFTYLHRSSLYWDEYVYLPIPGLRQCLLIAAKQNVEQALEEIAYIVAERPQQISAARAASLEIAVRELEMCSNLRDIAHVSQRLAEILPPEMALIDPRWVTPFARLNDASRDGARYCSPLGWQARRDALVDMLAHLKKIYPNTAFSDAMLNGRLGEVVNAWRTVAQQELEALDKAPDKTNQIGNPYNPGPALELRDSLFVGRRDFAQRLGEALSRGNHRPTFLLYGERRMGKSSTLKQLPDLLGSHYLPISYDLQIRGISSSASAFLGAIAEEIYKVMIIRGMRIKKLEYRHLQEASQQNEAAVYRHFDQWLKHVERTLEQEDRTLLLAFDEFEKLEEAGQDEYLNLRLLLDWFRSVIQNRPRLALLFSGTHTFGNMKMNWAGYFVNVQTLKVSFLQPEEARQLIAKPVPDFPSEQIFAEEAIEEIMKVTGCHPFLVQAVCSALMDHLNTEKLNRASTLDVSVAVSQVIRNWWNTYFRDMWDRTDDDQRACLVALRKLEEASFSQIDQQSDLDGKIVYRALEALLDRDLVLLDDQGNYRIATPIFSEWVGRSDHG